MNYQFDQFLEIILHLSESRLPICDFFFFFYLAWDFAFMAHYFGGGDCLGYLWCVSSKHFQASQQLSLPEPARMPDGPYLQADPPPFWKPRGRVYIYFFSFFFLFS